MTRLVAVLVALTNFLETSKRKECSLHIRSISRSLVSYDGKTGQRNSVHTLAGQEVPLTSDLPPA